MLDIIRKEKVNRLPILVYEMGKEKLLGFPQLGNGTSKAVAQTVLNTL